VSYFGSTMPFPTLRPERLFALVLFFLWSGCTGVSRVNDADELDRGPTVILVSLDGVRWDYFEKYDAPYLDMLAADGVRAERLTPVFPTTTFPNHYSVVTGLYPENHGIISNNIYDPDIDGRFSLSNQDAIVDPRWWEGEPLWVTAEKQRQIAATYFWPGSEAPIQDVRPTYWRKYDGRIPGEERVSQVLDWLDLPSDQRPSLITLYFSETDGAGHRHGPDSPEVADALRAVDAHVGLLVDGLRQREILDDVDIIVMSDHGMAATSEDRVIIIDAFFDPGSANIVDFGPAIMMYPPDHVDQDSLVGALDAHPQVDAYTKENIPDRFHIADHRRTPPIMALADEGWTFSTRERYDESPARYNGGSHGYDNDLESMGGIFIARGPSFRRGATVGPFENIHIYEMVCSILGLEPAANDGSLNAVADILAFTSADAQP